MFYTWLVIVVCLAIFEMTTISLVSIWFVFSGIIAMLASLFIDNITIQIAIFVILGLILMLLTRRFVKKIMPVKPKTNLDRIVGMEGIVTEKISKSHSGEVKVDGKRWTAISDETIAENSIVKITEMNSTKLTVKKVKEWYYGSFYSYFNYFINYYYSKY